MTRARDIANLIGSGNYSSTTFTATAGQTAFTISHTQGFVQVFMNGLLLDETVDYTSNGTAITLTSGAAAGDEIEVVAYNTFSVGDAITQTAADTRYANVSGDTFTGDTVISTTTQNQLRLENTAANSLGSYLKIRDGNSTAGQHTWIGRSTNDTYIFANNNDLGMKITGGSSGGGNVTVPNQPCFAAYNYSAAGTTQATYYNPMRWANVHSNVGNCFNNTTGVFTFPVTGKYLCFCNINLKATDAQWFGLHLLYNGTSSQAASWGYPASNSVYENIIISNIVSGTANDTMSFTWHNSYSAPDTNNSYNQAYIYLLG